MHSPRRLRPFIPPVAFLFSMAFLLAGIPFLFRTFGGSATGAVGTALACLVLPLSVLIAWKGEGKAIRARGLRSWLSGIYTLILLLIAIVLFAFPSFFTATPLARRTPFVGEVLLASAAVMGSAFIATRRSTPGPPELYNRGAHGRHASSNQ